MSKKKIPSLLFVCSGNICRSPALKGMMEHLLKEKGIHAYIESCGLHATFLGNPPDRKMQVAGESYGITLHDRAKLFEASFFDQFDAIFCVTVDVRAAVKAMAHTKEHQSKIFIASHFSEKYKDEEIPDPYFGGQKSFKHVWERVEDACKGILTHFFIDHSS
ncbi:MAG: low molecular weight phosphotyrosine protein phosphatase [Chlamydiales bacterium]|nr:low molecular weight phosphotyrosine protein phosphatase [Chlamydiales bacterium]